MSRSNQVPDSDSPLLQLIIKEFKTFGNSPTDDDLKHEWV